MRPLGGDRRNEVRLHRFLHNPAVTPHEMVATARGHTKSRIAGRHVLAIQDTTSLRDDGKKLSLQLHPAIAVDAADGALLGLVDAVFLHQDGAAKPHRHARCFDVKESRRWLDATCQAGELLAAGASRVSVIADREADVYETFAFRPAAVDLLIRVRPDRRLAGGWAVVCLH